MKTIANITLSKVNNGAHYTFMNKVYDELNSSNLTNEKLRAMIGQLKTAIDEENSYLGISRKSLITDQIHHYDTLRGTYLSSYRNALKGFMNIPDETMSNAAKVLNNHLKTFRITSNTRMDNETGLLLNLVEDLEKTYAEYIKILNLKSCVKGIKEANQKVYTLYDQRRDEQSNIAVGALKAARIKTDKIYKEIVRYINALITIEGIEAYEEIVNTINTDISHYRNDGNSTRMQAEEISIAEGSTVVITEEPKNEEKPKTEKPE